MHALSIECGMKDDCDALFAAMCKHEGYGRAAVGRAQRAADSIWITPPSGMRRCRRMH